MAGRLSWLQTPVAVIVGVVCLAAASMALSIETQSALAAAPLARPAAAGGRVPGAHGRSGGCPHRRASYLRRSPATGNSSGSRESSPPTGSSSPLTIVLVVFQAATGRGEPLPRLRPVHYVLALAVLWAVGSALVSHTLFQRAPLLKIVEAFGAVPVSHLLPGAGHLHDRAATADGCSTHSSILGAYLGLTVLFEMAGPHALVWPRYILDLDYGIHFGRGRGPFADAVANGFGLYVCALASCIAAHVARRSPSRRRPRRAAVLHRDTCSPWSARCGRAPRWPPSSRWSLSRACDAIAVPVIITGVVAVLLALLLVPGLSAKVQSRASDQGPVWDRENLTVAALNMISARPLIGFGWIVVSGRQRTVFPPEPELSAHRHQHRHPQLLPHATRSSSVSSACSSG